MCLVYNIILIILASGELRENGARATTKIRNVDDITKTFQLDKNMSITISNSKRI
jgi:hypothetical protein